MIKIRRISNNAKILALCKPKLKALKKVTKPGKGVLTFGNMSGILTKLFDGDEVQKSRTKKFEKLEKST